MALVQPRVGASGVLTSAALLGYASAVLLTAQGTAAVNSESATREGLGRLSLALDLTGPQHPLLEWKWEDAAKPEVLVCSLVLFFSGILCSAAGVGGGGIYVSALLVVGHLSPHEAVPLSKAIVFFGSVASLFVNLYKRTLPGSSVIDADVCRTVVPVALVGTFIGVLLNFWTKDLLIVSLLMVLLIVMTGAVSRTAWLQWCAELEELPQQGPAVPGLSARNPQDDGDGIAAAAASSTQASATDILLLQQGSAVTGGSKSVNEGALKVEDIVIAFWTLFMVVLSGVVHYHTQRCVDELHSGAAFPMSCKHPVVKIIFHGRMQSWLRNKRIAGFVQSLAMSLPIWSCSVTAFYYATIVLERPGWTLGRVLLYQVTAFFTGLLAGMVGIGGGLILSPFFLITGMDPSIAVGTSSTCVLFTSASTTLQYLFTDRIMVSLAIVYGLVVLGASCSGTALVHLLRAWLPTRKSYISFLVVLTVAISVALVMVKCVSLWRVATESIGEPNIKTE